MKTTDSVWIETRIERIPFDTCWHWVGSRNTQGYGVARNLMAHRVVYELYRGPIPEGLTLDHLCRVRDCVNPAHLEPCGSWENTSRGEGPSARNARATHCIYGHPLKDKNVREILNEFHRGKPFRVCQTCNRERAREHYRRKNPGWERRDYETHPEYPK